MGRNSKCKGFEEGTFFSYLKKYIFIYLAAPVLVAACRIFVAACGIFSCSVWTLSCSTWELVPWSGIEPGSPALGAWSLSHWTTREVLVLRGSTLDMHKNQERSQDAEVWCTGFISLRSVGLDVGLVLIYPVILLTSLFLCRVWSEAARMRGKKRI